MNKVQIYKGDCLDLFKSIDNESIDMIFADPPYNLSGNGFQTVKSGKYERLNKGKWDIIDDLDVFNYEWIKESIRVLKKNGTIWISGTLHNHPSIGKILKKLGLWIINDIIWYKKNAPPLFSKNRFVPSTELIWLAAKTKKYYFNYDLAKKMNNGKQMRNLWEINAKRHITKHPTEKPEELLERIILIGSKENDLILDPFLGSGTTAVIAKRLNRSCIGFEKSEEYYEMALQRLNLIDNHTVNSEKPLKQSINYPIPMVLPF